MGVKVEQQVAEWLQQLGLSLSNSDLRGVHKLCKGPLLPLISFLQTHARPAEEAQRIKQALRQAADNEQLLQLQQLETELSTLEQEVCQARASTQAEEVTFPHFTSCFRRVLSLL